MIRPLLFRRIGLCVGLLVSAACHAAEPATSPVRLFAPIWRDGGELTPEQVAAKFPVVFGHQEPKLFRAKNPEARCWKYLSGPFVTDSLTNSLREALALDRDEAPIKARGATGWLVVPNNFKWLQYLARTSIRWTTEGGFDGLFVDNMGLGQFSFISGIGQPVHPKSKQPFSRAQWLSAQVAMLTAVAEAVTGGKTVVLNGLGSGDRYWAEPEVESPRILLPFVHGAMADSMWRAPLAKLDEWPAPARWLLDVLMIQDVERRGLMGFWWTRCWTDGTTANNETDAAKLVPKWRRFTLASYLLGAGAKSHFNFDAVRSDGPEYYPEYDAPLGAAAGAMEQLGDSGVHGRPFANGAVLVNPTDKEASEVKLPWAALEMTTLLSIGENRTVTSPVNVPAHTGLILTIKK